MLELSQKAASAGAAPAMGADERRRVVEETKSQVLAAASPATPAPAAEQPSPEDATETMAQIFMKQGHWADALKAYETVLRRDPSRADVAQMVMDLRARLAPRPEAIPVAPPPPPPAEPVEPVAAAPRARSKPRVSYV
jgi:hypothetical protein